MFTYKMLEKTISRRIYVNGVVRDDKIKVGVFPKHRRTRTLSV